MHARASCSAGSRSTLAGGGSCKQPSELGEHARRLLDDVAVRVAAEVVLARVRLACAHMIALPGVAGAVVDVADELDGEAVLGPAAVDAPAARNAVGDRKRQAVLLQQGDELALEL